MYINTEKLDISMVRGDTLSFGLEFEGLDQDLDCASFVCGREYGSRDVVINKTIGNGIWKQDDTHYGVRIAPEDTKDLDGMIYYYDLQVGANGDIFTILHGKLLLEKDVFVEE